MTRQLQQDVCTISLLLSSIMKDFKTSENTTPLTLHELEDVLAWNTVKSRLVTQDELGSIKSDVKKREPGSCQWCPVTGPV